MKSCMKFNIAEIRVFKQKVINAIRNRAKKQTPVGKFFEAMYDLFKSRIVTIIYAIIPFWLLKEFYPFPNRVIGSFVLFAVVISSTMFSIANCYHKKRVKDRKGYMYLIKIQRQVLQSIHTGISASRKYISDSFPTVNDDANEYFEKYSKEFGLTNFAIKLCWSVYDYIKYTTNSTLHQVTISRILPWENDDMMPCSGSNTRHENCIAGDNNGVEKSNKYCFIIASHNEEGSSTSASMSQKHCFNYRDKKTKRQHFYIEILKSHVFHAKNNVAVLSSHEEIMKHFVFHEVSELREKELHQYIGIVINIHDTETDNYEPFALLQLDTAEKYHFGKTKEDLLKYANDIICIFADQLLLTYQYEGVSRETLNLFFRNLNV